MNSKSLLVNKPQLTVKYSSVRHVNDHKKVLSKNCEIGSVKLDL